MDYPRCTLHWANWPSVHMTTLCHEMIKSVSSIGCIHFYKGTLLHQSQGKARFHGLCGKGTSESDERLSVGPHYLSRDINLVLLYSRSSRKDETQLTGNLRDSESKEGTGFPYFWAWGNHKTLDFTTVLVKLLVFQGTCYNFWIIMERLDDPTLGECTESVLSTVRKSPNVPVPWVRRDISIRTRQRFVGSVETRFFRSWRF